MTTKVQVCAVQSGVLDTHNSKCKRDLHSRLQPSQGARLNILAKHTLLCGSASTRMASAPVNSRGGDFLVRDSAKSRAVSQRTNGSNAVNQVLPARQQRLAGRLSHVFASGKSQGTCGKRFMGDLLWRAIRRTSQRSLAILVIRGYAALWEQGAAGWHGVSLQSSWGMKACCGYGNKLFKYSRKDLVLHQALCFLLLLKAGK